MRKSLLSALLVLALPLSAQILPRARRPFQPYFPLALGNQWTYGVNGSESQFQVSVTGARLFNGNTYYQLTGYFLTGFTPQSAWVRSNTDGNFVEYDAVSGAERLWYMFSGGEGTSWKSQLPGDCIGDAAIQSRNADVQAPAGKFSQALIVGYLPTLCADAGFSEEAFAPGVGLLRRTIITIAGPRTYELLFAVIDGAAVSGPEVSFRVSLDRPVYVADFMPVVDPAKTTPVVNAQLTVRNTTQFPLTLRFSSGQLYDVAIRDSAGKTVYAWSANKLFAAVVTNLELSPGEKTWLVQIPLTDGSRTLPAGQYTLEAWLTTAQGKVYTGSVPFDLQHVF